MKTVYTYKEFLNENNLNILDSFKNANIDLQTYNESLRDKMTGPSVEDVIKKIEKLPFAEKVISAAKYGLFDMLKDTLENIPANITQIVFYVREIIKEVSKNGNVDILTYILDKYNVNYDEHFIDTIIRDATEHSNNDMVKVLLKRFPRIDVTKLDNWLLRIAIIFGNLELTKLFLEYGADITDTKKKLAHSNENILDIARNQGFHDVVDYVESLL